MSELSISPATDGVVEVMLDRPPGNLWTIDLLRLLIDFLEDPPKDAHIVRLRAAGEAFCMGREREGTTPGALREEVGMLVATQRALRQTRLVTVAEVHGAAAGFGVGIVAACDVSVATADARFSFPEVNIGLAPALVLAWLPRVVGEREAFWLTATGEQISAERAQRLGLLNAVVGTGEELRKAVDERVDLLRSHPARVHADIRDMIRAFAPLGDDDALEMSIDRLVIGSLRRREP